MCINILLPMASKNLLLQDKQNPYPIPLIEVGNKPIIQLVIENLSQITKNKKFTFILREEDCMSFHLDNSIRLLTNEVNNIVQLKTQTQGSACSCLMAVDEFNPEDALLIVNSDQIFDCDLNKILAYFEDNNADAGVITFPSVHPRWSYARIEKNNSVIETAEKNPISNNAIAGFYYFKKSKDFFNSAMRMIEKNAAVNDLYYIAPSLNEMVLAGKNIMSYNISAEQYHTFYSQQKIKDYERRYYETS